MKKGQRKRVKSGKTGVEEKREIEKKIEPEHVIKIKKKHVVKLGYFAVFVIAFTLIMVLFIKSGAYHKLGQLLTSKPEPTSKEVRFDLYAMSQCPFGTQVEDALKPVMDKVGDAVELNIEFIAAEMEDGTFRSLHGQPEVEGDIIHLCAEKYYPDNYLDFIVCQNKNPQDFKPTIEACAGENNMNADKIKECFEGDDGKELLSESVKKSQEVGATGSPTIYINDEPYSGNRDADSFIRALCAHIEEHPTCDNLPKPVEVKMTVLTDKNCKLCDSSQIVGVIKQRIFPGAEERYVDVSTEEGKQLVESMEIKMVPAYIFSSNIVETTAWKSDARLQSSFEQKGDYFKLLPGASGSSYPADAETRQQVYDKLGITKDDNHPQIDFFVMSYCPYGNQAEELIEKVYDVLGDKAEFNPRYVIYSNYRDSSYCLDEEQKYCSMHGLQELNQNIRELCVNKYYGISEWFEFAIAMNSECNYQNADTCWTDVATDLGLDTDKISTCEEEEGIEFARADKELNDLLGVRGSPTIFIDGEQYSGQRSSQAILTTLCMFYDTEPAECSTEITGTAAVSGTC